MIPKLRKFMIGYPILATIIVVILVELVFRIAPFELILPKSWQLGGTLDRCIYAILGMLFLKFFMKSNLKEIGYSTYNLKEGLGISLLIVLIPLFVSGYTFLQNIISGVGHFMSTTEEILKFVDYLALYFSVGLFEETAYRALPVNILRNKDGLSDRKLMWYSLLISSVIFGLTHVLNIISGFDTPINAIGRAIQATGSGMIFGAIYWRTGSLTASIIGHALWDSCSMLNECIYVVEKTAETATTQTATGAATLIDPNVSTLISCFFMFVFDFCIALFILSKKKYTGCKIQAPSMREQFKVNDPH